MRRGTPSSSDSSIGWSRELSSIESLAWIGTFTRHAFVVVVLSCMGVQLLSASANELRGGLTVQRSMRAAPHRLIVHPSGATVAADRTQRFSVTDAQGKPVAVRWNVSGIGCSGTACGRIDDQGVYEPPPSLPHPGIVTIEGVLVSDPNYSVLAEVRLQTAIGTAVAPVSSFTSAQRLAENKQQLAAPLIERQPVSNSVKMPPLPSAVTAAPEVGTQKVGRGAQLPLPGAVAAAPDVDRQNFASGGKLPPVPNAVGAAPVIGKQNVARSGELPLTIIAPAPQVEERKPVRASQMSPPAPAEMAAPVVRQDNVARSNKTPPSPKSEVASLEVGPGPSRVVSNSMPRSSPGLMASASPSAAQIFPPKPQPLSVGVTERKNPSTNTLLPQMQDLAVTVSAKVPATLHPSGVSYNDGQLRIDAENVTLAAVLKLVAEKTGAVIEVPPGTGTERIFEHIGPGRPEDVLASLLNGSPFDFVIVGSPLGTHEPTQVLLSMRGTVTPAMLTPEPPKTVATSSPLWTPPPAAPPAAVLPPIDPATLPPKEQLTPEVLGQLMKDKARELRDQLQQQQPPSPSQQ
jgi:hypothetical protein